MRMISRKNLIFFQRSSIWGVWDGGDILQKIRKNVGDFNMCRHSRTVCHTAVWFGNPGLKKKPKLAHRLPKLDVGLGTAFNRTRVRHKSDPKVFNERLVDGMGQNIGLVACRNKGWGKAGIRLDIATGAKRKDQNTHEKGARLQRKRARQRKQAGGGRDCHKKIWMVAMKHNFVCEWFLRARVICCWVVVSKGKIVFEHKGLVSFSLQESIFTPSRDPLNCSTEKAWKLETFKHWRRTVSTE